MHHIKFLGYILVVAYCGHIVLYFSYYCRESGKNCKCLEFSADGSRAAWYNGTALQIYDVVKDKLLHTIECAPLTYLQFSPKSTILAVWQVYSSGKLLGLLTDSALNLFYAELLVFRSALSSQQ